MYAHTGFLSDLGRVPKSHISRNGFSRSPFFRLVLFYVRFLPEIEFYFLVDFGLLVWRAPMTLGVGLLYVIYS